MENKEIYIDGVDVSGCDFYDKNKKYCLTLKMDTKGFKNPSCFSGDFQECIQDSKVCPYTFCDNNPNCYYKQLKAKEQECERLKERLIKCDDNIIVECEYSKNDLCSFIHRKKEVINCLQAQLDKLKADNDLFRTCHDNEQAKRRKLEQTLTEIKEIACRLPIGVTREQILQKISEVIYE